MSNSVEPTVSPTRQSYNGYYSSGAGVVITVLIFGLTIVGTVIVCIRRCILLRALEREHAERYRLEIELENAPEVAAEPYMDVDYAVVERVRGDDLNSDCPLDVIPPAEKLQPLRAENVTPFHDVASPTRA